VGNRNEVRARVPRGAVVRDREAARVAALERLAKLHDHGALTDEEFAWEKKKILDELG
jgi:hypothetical protein